MRVMQGAEPATARLTSVQWLIIAVACVGFAFDLYETLMMALLVRPAIGELSGLRPGTPAFNLWVGLLFYVPNVAAGVFGLLGGYFADLFGRRRILFWLVQRDSPRRFGSY
jgi:MFS family permease